MENSEINTKALNRSMQSLRSSFKAVSQGSRNTVKQLQQLKKALEGAAQSSGKLNRSLASFDQLNRLSAPASGSASGQVKELTESLQELRLEALKPINITSMDNLPSAAQKAAGSLTVVADELLRGNINLMENSELWKHLTVQMDVSTQGMKTFQTQTVRMEEVAEASRKNLWQMILNMDSTAGAALGLKTEILQLRDLSLVSFDSMSECWKSLGVMFAMDVSDPVKKATTDMFEWMTGQSKSAWDATTGVFGQTGNFFQQTFSNAWSRVKSVFSDSGPVFEGIKEGVLSGFKVRVNALIDGINKVVPDSFNGINAALNKLRNIRIGTLMPFKELIWTANIPRIPHLAQGAVLPANKPFMAVVGDQHHGTNVEAPLATITEAVKLAMEDLQDGNLSGHRATVEILGRILEAVRNIHLTDGEIAAANHRYQQKQAVVYGF